MDSWRKALERSLANRRTEAFLLLGLIALAAALRFFRLGFESLWADEFYTWAICSVPEVGEVLAKVSGSEPHPPLFFLLYHYLLKFLPPGDAWLRAPAALAGTLTVPLFYLALRRWGRAEAAVAALLLAVIPMHVWYSQEARAPAFKVLLEVLVLYTLVKAIALRHDKEPQRCAGWALCGTFLCGIGLQLHFFFLFIASALLGMFLLGLWERRKNPSLYFFVPPLMLLVIILDTVVRAFLHWQSGVGLTWMPERYGPMLLLDAAKAQLVGPLWNPWSMLWTLAIILAGTVVCVAGAWSLSVRAPSEGKAPRRELFVLLGVFIFFCFVLPLAISFVKPLVYHGQRHLVIATVFVAILLAWGGLWRTWTAALLAFVLLFQLGFLAGMYQYRQKRNWEGAARAYVERSTPNEPLVVVPGRLSDLVARYLAEPRTLLGAESVAEASEAAPRAGEPFWVLSFGDPRETLTTTHPGASFSTGLIETHRPGQELWLVRVGVEE